MSKRRTAWVREMAQKQRNALPTDTLRNDADFNDALLHPRYPLTLVQRVGAVVVGMMFLSPALLILVMGRELLADGWFGTLVLLAGIAVFVFVCCVPGVTMLANGISGKRASQRRSVPR